MIRGILLGFGLCMYRSVNLIRNLYLWWFFFHNQNSMSKGTYLQFSAFVRPNDQERFPKILLTYKFRVQILYLIIRNEKIYEELGGYIYIIVTIKKLLSCYCIKRQFYIKDVINLGTFSIPPVGGPWNWFGTLIWLPRMVVLHMRMTGIEMSQD